MAIKLQFWQRAFEPARQELTILTKELLDYCFEKNSALISDIIKEMQYYSAEFMNKKTPLEKKYFVCEKIFKLAKEKLVPNNDEYYQADITQLPKNLEPLAKLETLLHILNEYSIYESNRHTLSL